jgi:hypothetical protein
MPRVNIVGINIERDNHTNHKVHTTEHVSVKPLYKVKKKQAQVEEFTSSIVQLLV